MKNTLRFLRLSFVQELKKTFAYPTTFWIIVFIIPLYSFIQIIFLESIYSFTNNFIGYSKYEAYVLFGTYTIVQSLGHFAFYNRLAELGDLIRGGSQETLDFALIKPVDSQAFATLGKFNFGNIAPLFIAVVVVLYGLSNQPQLLSIFNIGSYLLLVAMGIMIFYLLFLFISTFLFWQPDLQMTEDLWESVQSFGQYPPNLYNGLMGIIFNFVIPITLMAGIPTNFLFAKTSSHTLILYLFIMTLLFYLTRLFWTVAIKKYSSSSS